VLARETFLSVRDQLELFCALPGNLTRYAGPHRYRKSNASVQKPLTRLPLESQWRAVALFNRQGGVSIGTLAHAVDSWCAQDKLVVVDANPQGSAFNWSARRANKGLLLGMLGLARDTQHVEGPEIARDVHHDAIDGSPRMAAPKCSAMQRADLALVPAQPSPFDGWAAASKWPPSKPGSWSPTCCATSLAMDLPTHPGGAA
jgi:hypothetical protein